MVNINKLSSFNGRMENLEVQRKHKGALVSFSNWVRGLFETGTDAITVAEAKEKMKELGIDGDSTERAFGIKTDKQVRQLVNPDPFQKAGAAVKETGEMAKVQSALTSARLELQTLQSKVRQLEARPAAHEKPAEPSTEVLAECALAAYGEAFVNQISNITHDESEFRDRLCRAFHLDGLNVHNLDLSAQEKRFGKPNITGLRRIATGRMQKAINDKLK